MESILHFVTCLLFGKSILYVRVSFFTRQIKSNVRLLLSLFSCTSACALLTLMNFLRNSLLRYVNSLEIRIQFLKLEASSEQNAAHFFTNRDYLLYGFSTGQETIDVEVFSYSLNNVWPFLLIFACELFQTSNCQEGCCHDTVS